MKRKRAARALQLMREAFTELGEDVSLQEARDFLMKASQSLQKVESTRTAAKSHHESFQAKAMLNYKKWQESLQQGLDKIKENIHQEKKPETIE